MHHVFIILTAPSHRPLSSHPSTPCPLSSSPSSSPLSSLHSSFLPTLPFSFPYPPATEDVFDGMEGFEADNERDYTPFSQSDDDSLLTDGELKRSRSGLQVKHLTNNPSLPCFCSVVSKYLYFVQHLDLCHISVLGCEVYVFSVRQGPFTRHYIRTYTCAQPCLL